VIAHSPAILLAAALASGLMVGIERGWRLRSEPDGSRVAGVRTYTLIGAGGGLAGILSSVFHPAVSLTLAIVLAGGVGVGFWRDRERRDATGFVAALVVLGLGILAGVGQPALAVAGAAVVTLVLATRSQSHRLIASLSGEDLRAFARYAVIVAAVLPFLPNREMGPFGAWNPFQLWLVVVLVTGFSFGGYVANRTIGAKRGTVATAIIGGAYSSTAVTASLARRLGRGESGPLATGIALASAVMYLRVIALVAILSPSTLPQFLVCVGPAAATGIVAAIILWKVSPDQQGRATIPGNPIEIWPALAFVTLVAGAAVFVRWAQTHFGEAGIAVSLFLAGSFDVDAAIVTLSGLPVTMIDRGLAATALGGTIVANMALKIVVAASFAKRRGAGAIAALSASTFVLLATLCWRLFLA
jgi:uncharacterized membrane protein (DUF4010 family)